MLRGDDAGERSPFTFTYPLLLSAHTAIQFYANWSRSFEFTRALCGAMACVAGDGGRLCQPSSSAVAHQPDAARKIETIIGRALFVELERARRSRWKRNPARRTELLPLVDLGVTRISLGVQSFDDDELVAMDRIHTAQEAKQGFAWAREAGFKRINLDLIYGLPEQPMERWQSNVDQALAQSPDHLSLYALTVEEGTKLAYDIDHRRAPAPNGDLQADVWVVSHPSKRSGVEHMRYLTGRDPARSPPT